MSERERGGCSGDYFYSRFTDSRLPQNVYCALYRLYCHHLSAVMVISE